MNKKNIQFISPVDGDMLHVKDGVLSGNFLEISVKLLAPAGANLLVNGRPAKIASEAAKAANDVAADQTSAVIGGDQTGTRSEEGGENDGQKIFTARVLLSAYRNELVAEDTRNGEKAVIVVYRLLQFAGKYRLSIDDNIWFLRDIQQHIDTYQSLFDNPFLGFLKQVNELYGTKVHLNLFYQTSGFDLSQMSDRFRSEWQRNAGWLRLSFHALAEFPDKPYQHAGYEEVRRDCELVMKEIRRFAGKEVMGQVTTIHWGEATVGGSRALRDCGYTGQLGYFNVDDDLPAVSYYLSVEERRHIKKRFVWRDNREDITFVRTSIVLDKTELDRIAPHLDRYARDGNKPPYLDLLVHEQYFYPFYEAYQPDYRDRILKAAQWARDNGYVPGFLSEALADSL